MKFPKFMSIFLDFEDIININFSTSDKTFILHLYSHTGLCLVDIHLFTA